MEQLEISGSPTPEQVAMITVAIQGLAAAAPRAASGAPPEPAWVQATLLERAGLNAKRATWRTPPNFLRRD